MSHLFDIRDRHILVTGGRGLLGEAILKTLRELGACVTSLDLFPVPDHTREVTCDLNNVEEIRSAVSKVEDEWGPIDILINNAASRGKSGDFFDSVEEYQPATWNEVMKVNLDAVFWMSQAVGRRMAQRESGCIINSASIYASDLGVDQRIYPHGAERMNAPASYSASKAGVLGVTRYLATYWGHKGIRVNAVAPGGIEDGQPEFFRAAYSNRVPLGRMASLSDIVGVYAFLASPAAEYITGQCIFVDGGLSSW